MNVHVNVQNFGPIEKAEIDLRPLTVFVGESNTGKTYLAALIYALHQNFGGFSHFLWSDSIVSFRNSIVHGLRYRYPESQQAKLEQEMLEVLEKLNTPGRPFKFADLPQQVRVESLYKLTDPKEFTNELKRCFDLESVSKLIRFTGDRGNKM